MNQKAEAAPRVELIFPVHGRSVPVDHGWPLYSAISQHSSTVHDDVDVHVGPIEGAIYEGKGTLRLTREARLPIRLPAALTGEVYRLAGKKLDVKGTSLRLGVPATRMLKPVDALNARIVICENRQSWLRLQDELQRQLQVLGVHATIEPGRRRVLAIRGARNVGWAVGLSDLDGEDAIKVQAHGLGGRRSMGAGFFRPGPLPEGARARPKDLDLIEEVR